MTDLDALQVGDGIERAWLAADERADTELARAEPPCFLSIDSANAPDQRKRNRSDNHKTRKRAHHRAAVLGTISV